MAPEQLISAIRAALDETERIAREAGERSRNWHADGSGYDRGAVEHDGDSPYPIVYDEGHPTEAESRHIAHNDPAAGLRRVAAMRDIVDAYEEQLRRQEENSRDFAAELAAPSYSFDPARLTRLKEAGWQIAGRVDGLCAAVRALARGLGINPETETPQ